MESLIRPRAVDYLANFRNQKTAPVFIARFKFRHGREPGRVFAGREPIAVNLKTVAFITKTLCNGVTADTKSKH